jgi:hypothetical protein
MVPRNIWVFVAMVCVVLASGCSGGSEPEGSAGSPTSSAAAASTEETPSETRLVVLGDSNAHPSSCYGCEVFADQVAEAMSKQFGWQVRVVNLGWALDNPHPAQVTDVDQYVRTDEAAREAIRGAHAVLILVSQNDLAYNRGDDPCGVAPNYPRIRWADLTHECMDEALADYERGLESLLDEIDHLSAGHPTLLRIVTAYNTVPGDLVDPTWNSKAALEPSAYDVTRTAAVQCRLATQHNGECADVVSFFNGPEGRGSAQSYLDPLDATHLNQAGHDAIARSIIDLGFRSPAQP